MKKIVVKFAIEDDRSKKKAFKQVAGVDGVDSVSVDMKEKKMTVIGDVDPVHLICKLRKLGFADLLSVGPAKEEKRGGEKKEEKKEGEKKQEKAAGEKKEESKSQGDAKKENKAEPPKVEVVYVPMSYEYRVRPYDQYTVVKPEEYPNTCVIC
ncbi:heavy metal-associated isoprenylated plant protein 39 [Cryptomeria japonica]|uniref:heavy metal-associated isoprenylated plant protein 39 n=1 Tax=Cryptomeria japonica TaxID=3369 RepID=UPI0027DA7ADE|nr:heavy metal-associated isoprenylated plant protein 39 [Cryptomeria japonica]